MTRRTRKRYPDDAAGGVYVCVCVLRVSSGGSHGARLISSNVPHGVILEHGSRLPLVCCAVRSVRVCVCSVCARQRVPSYGFVFGVREMRRRRRRRPTTLYGTFKQKCVYGSGTLASERATNRLYTYLHACREQPSQPPQSSSPSSPFVVPRPRPRHQTTNAICRR